MRWVWLVLLGCRAHSPSTHAVDDSVVYQANFVGMFGPIESASTGEVFQSELEVRMQLRLRLEPTRGFRDGSYGRNIHIDVATVHVGTDDVLSAVPTELRGRTVELRTFPDGEILDVTWADKVAGLGRYLDVFEIMYPALSPSAPTIAEGDVVKQRIIWPFRKENMMRWDNIVDASWHNHGKSELAGVEAWSLSYEGAWGTEGKTRGTLPKQEWRAHGVAKGDAHFDKETSNLIQHSMDWSRDVTVRGEAGVVIQRQRFTGSVERVR